MMCVPNSDIQRITYRLIVLKKTHLSFKQMHFIELLWLNKLNKCLDLPQIS